MYFIKWIRKSDKCSGYIPSGKEFDIKREFSSPTEALKYLKKEILPENAWGLDRFDYMLERQTTTTVGKLESKTIIDWV